MKTTVAFLVLSALVVTAQDQKGETAAKMSASMAATNLNRDVVVTGKVAQVSIREKLVYLNLDKPYPQTPLSCVIFAKNTNQFNLSSLKGKEVEIKGKVTEHNEKPQIILTSSNQVKVVEAKTE